MGSCEKFCVLVIVCLFAAVVVVLLLVLLPYAQNKLCQFYFCD